MFVHHMCAWCPPRPEGIRCPGIRITDSCEPTFKKRKLNPDPLEEQPVFLNDLSNHLNVPPDAFKMPHPSLRISRQLMVAGGERNFLQLCIFMSSL